MFWFIVLLLLVGAGFYFYQKMMSIEREIRAEQEIEKAHIPAAQEFRKAPEVITETTVFDSVSASAADASERTTLEKTIIAEVVKHPGLKQTDLYPFFAETSQKKLQKVFKEMADSGILKRQKQGSSYLLYPA